MENLLQIIHEDAELLVMNKPADLVCHPSKNGPMSSLIGRVRLYLGDGARPHLVNRLDRETSGVTLAAKTDDVARELRQLWESREVEKEYLAIVHGHVQAEQGMIDAPLGRDEASRVAIKDCVRADGLPSQTEYFVERRFSKCIPGESQPSKLGAHRDDEPGSIIRRFKQPDGDSPSPGGEGRGEGELSPAEVRGSDQAPHGTENKMFSLLRLLPRTGRKHQIRIHLAHMCHPIVGDKIYGGDEDLYLSLVERRLNENQRRALILPHHALHARSLRFTWRGQPVEFSCEPEPSFTEFYSGLTF